MHPYQQAANEHQQQIAILYLTFSDLYASRMHHYRKGAANISSCAPREGGLTAQGHPLQPTSLVRAWCGSTCVPTHCPSSARLQRTPMIYLPSYPPPTRHGLKAPVTMIVLRAMLDLRGALAERVIFVAKKCNQD